MGNIPKIIHQTWRSSDLDEPLRGYRDSWVGLHPDWDYQFWDDQAIELFVNTEFPDLMPLFNHYSQTIMRVDMFRYLLMSRIGGVYVDIDYEALHPIDSILEDATLLLTEEPEDNLHSQAIRTRGMTYLLSNAFLASEAGHPFWVHLLTVMERAKYQPQVLDATGPYVLTKAYDSFPKPETVAIIGHALLSPKSRLEISSVSEAEPTTLVPTTEGSKPVVEPYAVHHWMGSWHVRKRGGRKRIYRAPAVLKQATIRLMLSNSAWSAAAKWLIGVAMGYRDYLDSLLYFRWKFRTPAAIAALYQERYEIGWESHMSPPYLMKFTRIPFDIRCRLAPVGQSTENADNAELLSGVTLTGVTFMPTGALRLTDATTRFLSDNPAISNVVVVIEEAAALEVPDQYRARVLVCGKADLTSTLAGSGGEYYTTIAPTTLTTRDYYGRLVSDIRCYNCQAAVPIRKTLVSLPDGEIAYSNPSLWSANGVLHKSMVKQVSNKGIVVDWSSFTGQILVFDRPDSLLEWVNLQYKGTKSAWERITRWFYMGAEAATQRRQLEEAFAVSIVNDRAGDHS